MNPKKKNQSDTFYKLQEQELRWLKSNKLINNASYIYLALKIQNPFCDRPIKIKVKEFALYWGVPESSIYECITKLRELESITIQTKEIIISWRTHYQQEVPSDIPESFRDSRMDSRISETPLTSQNGFQDSRANSENLESDIYKDRARAQTSSDLDQTHSNNLGGGAEFALPEEETGIPTQSPLPEQPCQQSNSTNDTPYPEDKSSASGCDNSAFVGHGNVAPDGKARPFNQLTGKWSSIPSDPWMEGINPAKEFKQWVCKQAIAEGKNYSLSNAAGEIRNNFQRAGDLWDEYLDAQEKARQTEIIKEQVQQETKPRAVEVTASQSQPTPFAFYRNAIKNRLPMLQQFRQRGIEWAEQQPDVVIIRDENGEIIDIEEF